VLRPVSGQGRRGTGSFGYLFHMCFNRYRHGCRGGPALSEQGAAGRWPTKLRRQLAAAPGPGAVQAIEDKERRRWVAAAIQILVSDGYPIAALAAKTSDPEAVIRRAFGGRRASTLRRRVRTWRRVRSWLLASGYPVIPVGDVGAAHISEYLGELASGGCGATTPKYVRAALGFFASCGGIALSDRSSDHVLVAGTVKDLEREIEQRSGTEVKKAPHFPVRVLASLETAVVSPDLQRYKRVLAWYKLLRVWGGAQVRRLAARVPGGGQVGRARPVPTDRLVQGQWAR